MKRVVYARAGAVPSALHPLGADAAGTWGELEESAWPGGDGVELLYLTPAAYAHAVRRLPPEELSRAVQHRRRTFSADLVARAVGIVEEALAMALPLCPASSRQDLLTAVASFTAVPRYAATPRPRLLDYVREGDGAIVAELQSDLMRAEAGAQEPDPGGRETAARARMAGDLAALMMQRGMGERFRGVPHVDVVRTFLVEPASAEAEAYAETVHDPVVAWRGGLLMPVQERAVERLAQRHRLRVVFASAGMLLDASAEGTDAQLDVEVEDRLQAPRLTANLAQMRIDQAITREGARLLTADDPELGALLRQQVDEEAGALLGPAAAPDAAREALERAIVDARLLAGLARRAQRPTVAERLDALASAAGHVAAEL